MFCKWFIFGLIMFFAPVLVIGVYYFFPKCKKKIDEQKKKTIIRVVARIGYYWLIGIFYMVSFHHWLRWQFILGVLIIVVFYAGLAGTISFSLKKGTFITLGNLLDLAIGIGVSAYLLYLIPYEKMQDTLVPVVAAAYGGLITLVGVAWTIKTGERRRKEDREQLERDRNEEERKKTIPFVARTKHIPTDEGLRIESSCISYYEENCHKNPYCGISIKDFAIKNISNNPLIINAVVLNEITLEFEMAFVLEKNGEINLIFGNRMIKSEEMIKDLHLVLCDIFGNKYKVQCILSYEIGRIRSNEMYASFEYTVKQLAFPKLINEGF